MWNEICNNTDLIAFLEKMYYFHDSCVKEIRYLSGAYVKGGGMHPINDQKMLSVILQGQFDGLPMIELLFEELKYLKLFPVEDSYTCEILDVTMFFKNDCVYWCDCGGISELDIDNYDGTIICAKNVRWRKIDLDIGNNEYFVPISC